MSGSTEVLRPTGMVKAEIPRSQEIQPVIQVENVSKLFRTPPKGAISALQNITLNIPNGEFVTVVGPSGCGKSTLLKLIAGFSPPSSGRILCQNQEVRGLNTKVGYVPAGKQTLPLAYGRRKRRIWFGYQTLPASKTR